MKKVFGGDAPGDILLIHTTLLVGVDFLVLGV